MLDHAKVVLGAIVPNRKDLLLYAVQHLEDDHFRGDVLNGIWRALNRYYDIAGGVLPATVLTDALAKDVDAAKALLYQETFSEIENLTPLDHEFRYSVQALKDQRAEQLTGEAITTSFEILMRGAEVGRDTLRGHVEARQFALEQFADIDRLTNVEGAPEGNMMGEGSEVAAEYIDKKTGKVEKGILTGIPVVDKVSGGFQRGELCLICAYTNQGKASPLHTPVLTPQGWRTMGDLEVGDAVVGSNGKPTLVTGVYDRGEMPVFRVTFSDGSSVLTAGDHLWAVQDRSDRHDRARKVLSTDQLAEGLRARKRLYIPLVAPVEYSLNPDLPVDPYTLGILLGLGVCGLTSDRIPTEYLTAPVEARWELLRGLMDSGGYVSASGRNVGFDSASEGLAREVQELAESLGGACRLKHVSESHWEVSVKVPENPFRRTHKAALWNKKKRPHTPARRVVSVLPEGREVVRCIAVAAEDSLYVTERFIVTHNTQLCCQIAWSAAVEQGKNVFFATSETVRATVRRRIVARHSRLPQFGLPKGLDSTDLKNGTLSVAEEKVFKEVLDDLKNNPTYGKLHIAQIPRGATLSYVEARMNRAASEWQVDLAVCDYLALLKSDRQRGSEREEMNEILKDAKVFATSFQDGRGVPFISPWQIKQASYKDAQTTGAYGLASLADTSEAEKSSDQILTLLRQTEQQHQLSLQFLKMRDGDIPNALTLQVDFRNAYLGTAGGGVSQTNGFSFSGPSSSFPDMGL